MPKEILDAEGMLDSLESGQVRVLKPENMDFHNSLQVNQSTRFLYSSEGDFSLVIDMLKTNPECMNSPRLTTN